MQGDNRVTNSQESIQTPQNVNVNTDPSIIPVPPIETILTDLPIEQVKKPINRILVVSVGIVLLLIFGILGYFIYINSFYKPATTSEIIESATTPEFSGDVDIFAVGFPLKLPKDWKISISNKSESFFAARLFIPDTDPSITYVEIQAGNTSDFTENPTLKITNNSKDSNGFIIKSGNENLLESSRVFYQVEKEQSGKMIQMTLIGDEKFVEMYKHMIISIIPSYAKTSLNKLPNLVKKVNAQEIFVPTETTIATIAGFDLDLWKQISVMEGPYPERLVKDTNPYKGGYAKLYKFQYLAGQRVEILAEENKEDLQTGGSFIESELYDKNGQLITKAGTRISLGVDKVAESGTYYLLVKSYTGKEGRFLLKIFDLDQVQDLYYVHYSDGSEYVTNNLVKSQTKNQPAVLIVRYVSPIEVVDNNHVRYFRKADNGCIACTSYVFGDKTVPYTFTVNGVEVPVKITKLFLNQALIQPLDMDAFPANSQISFDINYGEDPNVPGSHSGFSGGFRTY